MCNFTEIPLVETALIHADGQTHKQADRQMGRKIHRQTDRQTDRQTKEGTGTTKLVGAFHDMRTCLKSLNLTEDVAFPFP